MSENGVGRHSNSSGSGWRALVPLWLFLAGHLGLAIWFAARVDERVTNIYTGLTAATASMNDLSQKVYDLKVEVVANRTEMNALRRDLQRVETDARDLRNGRVGAAPP